MKLTAALAALMTTFNIWATPSRLEVNAKKICDLALLCDSYAVTKTTPKEMIFEYALEMDGEEPLEYMDSLPKNEIPGIDDVIWGRLTMRQALLFVRSFVDPDYGTISKEKADEINKAIINMAGTGVEFGFTPSTGGHVCGSVWPGLLIMDPKSKTVWDIGLFGFPEC